VSARQADPIDVRTVRNLAALFRERARRSPDAIAYRHFDASHGAWIGLSWSTMIERIARWQRALAHEGFRRGDRVAIMLSNGPDWVCFDQAALSLGLVVVPLFINDRPDNLAYMLERSASRLVLIEGRDQWQTLAPVIPGLTGLRIVSRGRVPEGDSRVAFLDDWLSAGTAAPAIAEVGSEDLATIVFTSGTVGRPKGVMLTHGNILWNAAASYESNPIYVDDLMLSFLPLSHMFERTLGYYLAVLAGTPVAYARSIPQLAEDLQTIRPTVLISVPRIYERVHGRIRAQMQERSPFARWLFRHTVEIGWRRFERMQHRSGWRPSMIVWPILDRLVARKVAARLGGRLRLAVCGGAPLSREVARTFIGLGLPIVQGYGMTELSPVVSGNTLADNEPASVGRPLRDVEVRISAEGELLVRSPGVMRGYLDDPEATARTIDREGWLHTGDKAEIREGRLYITGRLKDIIVLSNGEKIPPADMELAILRDPLFEQVMIVGEGRPYLSAIVVLSRDGYRSLAAKLDLDPDDPATLQRADLGDALCARIGSLVREFPGYAQVRRVAATLEPWTVENGLLTSTLKLRRNELAARFGDVILRLYAGH
jgi:long-chain acyl-CoA synthetase